MDFLITAFIAFFVGAVIGVIGGSMLGWARVLELYDELETVRAENKHLKENSNEPQVIEITDSRPQAADITKNYFTKF